MYIILGADIVPTKVNQQLFASADIKNLVGEELQQLFSNAEYRVLNLETPLVDALSPIKKLGPNLSAKQAAAVGMKALGVDLVTLANNHIMDHGEAGLISTLHCLQENAIASFGAGDTPEQAAKPYIYETKQNKKIGFYACAEHEFSIVSQTNPGANPYDPLESFDHVQALKQQCDYVIVLYHGGKECYRYPSPMLQKTCRKFVEKGADLVVCQHSHCIGCEEHYKSGRIVYGQGNFLFNKISNEYWNSGLLLLLDESFAISYVPVVREGSGVRKAQGEQAEKILKDFCARSEQIKEPEFVEANYAAFAKSALYRYELAFSSMGKSPVFKVLQKLTGGRYGRWLLTKRYNKQKSYELQNFLECQAHWELFLTGVKGIRK